MRPRLFITVALVGFSSMLGQILLMRELIVVFYGNELSLGVMLGCWLFWTSIGSMVLGRLIERPERWRLWTALCVTGLCCCLPLLIGRPGSGREILKRLGHCVELVGLGSLLVWLALLWLQEAKARLAFCLLLVALILPPAILAAQSTRVIFGMPLGEITSYTPMLLAAFSLLAPLCLLFGFLFALICRVLTEETKQGTGAIGRAYVVEAIGAALAGLAFNFVLVRFATPFAIVVGLSVLNLAAAALIALDGANRRARLLLLPIVILAALRLDLLTTGILNHHADLTRLVQTRVWAPFEIVESRDSIYGRITVVRQAEQTTLYSNGLLAFTYPNTFAAEDAVHFALLEHEAPKRVLLVGGGAGGSLLEVLEHPIEQVDYVELDPLTVEIVTKHFPSELSKAIESPKVALKHEDGRLVIKRSRSEYDVIILDVPDPYTAQLNRFYTREFFAEAKAALRAGGVFSFRVTSRENYISAELQQFLACLYRTLKAEFADVRIVPGNTNVFLASCAENVLTLSPDALMARLTERGLKTDYVEYELPWRLMDLRVDTLRSTILERQDVPLNTDFVPRCYLYDMILWSAQFASDRHDRQPVKIRLEPMLEWLSRLDQRWLLACGAALLLVLAAGQKFLPRFAPNPVTVAIGTTGFAEIVVEVVCLLAFQMLYGYVYYMLGIILTGFMLGLVLGGWWMTRWIERGRGSYRAFVVIQAAVCLYPLALMLALVALSKVTFLAQRPVIANVAFSLMTLTAGVVGGLQFPLAAKLHPASSESTGVTAATLYGMDLFGACAGALLSSALIIPVMGIPRTCLVVLGLNVISLILLILRPSSGN